MLDAMTERLLLSSRGAQSRLLPPLLVICPRQPGLASPQGPAGDMSHSGTRGDTDSNQRNAGQSKGEKKSFVPVEQHKKLDDESNSWRVLASCPHWRGGDPHPEIGSERNKELPGRAWHNMTRSAQPFPVTPGLGLLPPFLQPFFSPPPAGSRR